MSTLKQDLIKIIKRHRPTRVELENALREAKRDRNIYNILGPVVKKKPRKLPKMPSLDQIQKLLNTMEADKNIKFRLMAKMLLYSGLRNFEIANLKIDNINLTESKIFIDSGKGNKDRYVIIFDEIRELLVIYLNANPRNRFLFENKLNLSRLQTL